MRRVQFAFGPWEQFPDGHPPEKSCEEERRAYRHGLTLQNYQDEELSYFERGILWFESNLQSSMNGSSSDAEGWDESTHLLGTNNAPDWPGSNMDEYNASLLAPNRVTVRHDSVTSLEDYVTELDKKGLEREVAEWNSGAQTKATDNKLRQGCEDVFITIPPGGLANCRGEPAFAMEDTFYNGYVADSYPCGVKRMLGGVLLVMAVVVAMAFFQT